MPLLERRFMLVAGLLAVAGVLLQADLTFSYYLAKGWSFGAALLKFVSYFTILTNTLVAVTYLSGAIGPRSALGRFFARPSVRTGVFLYTGLAGLLYAVLLSQMWNPRGWQLVADVLMHYVTPALYLLFWLLFVPGSLLPWRLAFQWLLYPAGYLAFILARGFFTHDYPYPFMNAHRLGWLPSLGNVSTGCFVFIAGGLFLIQLCRVRAQRATRAAEAAHARGEN